MNQQNKHNPRPVLQIPRSFIEAVCEAGAAIGLLLALFLFWRTWPTLPEQIPVHFNLAGQPDDWGSKQVFLVFPIMALLMYGGILLLSFYPHTYNYPWPITADNAPRQYQLARAMLGWMKCWGIWIMAFLEWHTATVALGQPGNVLGNWGVPFFGLLMVAGLIAYFRQAYKAR